MPRDVIFATDDVNKVLGRAATLGWSEIVVVHTGKRPELKASRSLQVVDGILVDKITKPRGDGTVRLFRAKDHARTLFEQGGADIVVGLEFLEEKDSTNERRSGFNQVLAAIASKRNIALGLLLTDLLRESPERQARILGRVMQNIRLCRKYGVAYHIMTGARTVSELRGVADMASLARQLGGASPWPSTS